MPDKPGNPFKFWEELKRRKVVRVIIGYAAAAYVLLELTSIIAEPWGLPEWTINFVSVLLIIGFFVTVIISWIFDVTPEGIKKTETAKTGKGKLLHEPVKRKFRVSDAIIAVLLVAVVILAYPRIFKKDKFSDIRDEDGRISVAVMPFENMTNDTLWNIWQEVIQYTLINDLTNAPKELIVRRFETMYDILQETNRTNYASLSPSIASDLSKKLNVNTFIQGSISESGDKFRINAQLVKTETEEIYKTFQIDGNSEVDIFIVTDSLSKLIRNYLQVEVMAKNIDYEAKSWITTNNPEVYQYMINATKRIYVSDWKSVIELGNKALKIDSNSLSVQLFLIGAYSNDGQSEKARQISNKINVQKDDINISYFDQSSIMYWEATFEKDMVKCIKSMKLFMEQDPYLRSGWYSLGLSYIRLEQYEEAIEAFEKVLDIDKQWEVSWQWIHTYTNLGRAYHEVGNHKREKGVYELGLTILPEDIGIIYRQAICAFSLGDTIEANGYLSKYIKFRKEQGWSESRVLNSLGGIYWNANIIDKAEQHYLMALELNPNYDVVMNNLAAMYFEQDINIKQGMVLINKALEANPDNAISIYIKGWGLYKEGKYEESLELLEKSWDLRPEYSHQHYLDIQEVKQALAKQKSEQ